MRRSNLDLVWIMVAAALVLFLAMFEPGLTWLRSMIALPLALYGIGYALGVVLFPLPILGRPERFVLSLGLSLSTLVLGGLLLHLLPFGLHPVAWASMLFLISLGAAMGGMFRRIQVERFPGQSIPRTEWRIGLAELRKAPADLLDLIRMLAIRQRALAAMNYVGKINPVRVVVISLSALILLLSIGLSVRPAPQAPYQGYTMFWMVPVQSSLSNEAGLGIRSMEFSPQVFRVELYAGGALVQTWEDIRLEPKQEWTVPLDLNQVLQAGGALEAHLFRLDDPTNIYRVVRLRQPGNG